MKFTFIENIKKDVRKFKMAFTAMLVAQAAILIIAIILLVLLINQ